MKNNLISWDVIFNFALLFSAYKLASKYSQIGEMLPDIALVWNK